MIITNEASKLLSIDQSRWISDFVSETGGGLIWLDSARSVRNISESWNALLPFQLDLKPEIVHLSAEKSARNCLRLGVAAMNEPALQLSSSDEKATIWDRLAALDLL